MKLKEIESLLTAKGRHMTEHEFESLLTVSVFYHRGKNVSEEMKGNFIYQIMDKRIKHFKIPVNDWLIVFISCIIDNPAKAVMWVYTLKQMYKQLQREINLTDFCELRYFGLGIPEEEEYKRIWDLQKVKPDYPKSDNALDDPEYWQ